ncbi:unnamed protein product, partial [Nesidiocoris tenuis]
MRLRIGLRQEFLVHVQRMNPVQRPDGVLFNGTNPAPIPSRRRRNEHKEPLDAPALPSHILLVNFKTSATQTLLCQDAIQNTSRIRIKLGSIFGKMGPQSENCGISSHFDVDILRLVTCQDINFTFRPTEAYGQKDSLSVIVRFLLSETTVSSSYCLEKRTEGLNFSIFDILALFC